MKRPAATAIFVMILVIVAFALGVANKIRTDRRAKTVVDSLNRRDPPNGAMVHEGPGAVSTSEPGPADNAAPVSPKDPNEQAGVDSYRLKIADLRKAVQAGDLKAVEAIRGALAPEDAAEIYALIFEIPATANEADRAAIQSRLVNVLQQNRCEETSKLLFTLFMTRGFLSEGDWLITATVLGNRKFREAVPVFEAMAFPQFVLSHSKTYAAARALVAMDPAHYLPRIAERIITAPESALFPYVSALAYSPESGYDIGVAVPNLQARFAALSVKDPGNRMWIAKSLENHATFNKSESTRSWLVVELTRLIESGGADPSMERDAYAEILKRLRR